MAASDRVYLEDARALNYCSAGLRQWMERQGFDIQAAYKDGLTFDELLATGSPAARKIVAQVKRIRENDGR